MKCKKAGYYINLFLDKDLSEKKKINLKIHLEACDSCRREFDTLKKTHELLNDIKYSSESKFLSAISSALLPNEKAKSFSFYRKKIAFISAVSVFSLITAFFTVKIIESRDNSLMKGLHYLEKTQNEDGSWNSNIFQKSIPVTSITLLSMMENKTKFDKEKYDKITSKATAYLLSSVQSNGIIIGDSRKRATIHDQAFGILTLSRIYSLNKAEEIKFKLELAVKAAEANQKEKGGWTYYFHSSAEDVIVSANMIKALIKAKESGIHCNNEVINKGLGFIKTYSADGNYNSYIVNVLAKNTLVSTENKTKTFDFNRHLSKITNAIVGKESEKPCFYYQDLLIYDYYLDYVKKNAMQQKKNICRFLLLKQDKEGSWTNCSGKNYATAIATYILAKYGGS